MQYPKMNLCSPIMLSSANGFLEKKNNISGQAKPLLKSNLEQ